MKPGEIALGIVCFIAVAMWLGVGHWLLVGYQMLIELWNFLF